MNNNYLIPANSKKSMLILGFFTGVDLTIFAIGCSFTLIMLLIFSQKVSFGGTMLILAPALISAFLVMPVPNYHNVLQLITNIITFILGRKRYYWRGWCLNDQDK